MQPDANAPLLVVKRFWTTYEPIKPGLDRDGRPLPIDPDAPKVREVDWVEYGPIGGTERTSLVEKVARLAKVIDRSEASANPAVALANLRWDAIRPYYENWKAGRELVSSGTPLAAWNRLSTEQADKLRLEGVPTVEALAQLTDTHVQRIGLPGMRDMIEGAKRFLAASATTGIEAALAAKDEEIAGLKAQMETLADLVRENMAEKAAAAPSLDDVSDEVEQERLGAVPAGTGRGRRAA